MTEEQIEAAWQAFKKLYKFSEDMDIECMTAAIKYDWETFKAGVTFGRDAGLEEAAQKAGSFCFASEAIPAIRGLKTAAAAVEGGE